MSARWLTLSNLACLGLLFTAVGCSTEKPEPEKPPQTFTAHGQVVMAIEIMGDGGFSLTDYCNQQFALVIGTQVPIKDPAGEVVAYGVLSPPTLHENQGTCVSTWDARGIPRTRQVFTYEVASYEPVFFKQGTAGHLVLNVPDGGVNHPVGA